MSPNPLQEFSHPDELLPWYVNGTLSPQEQHEVKDHIHSCSRCQQEVTLLEDMREQIQTTAFESPGESGLQRLLGEINKGKGTTPPQPIPQPQTLWKTLAIAASLIIAVQVGLLMDAWYFSKPMVPLSGSQHVGIVLQVSFLPTATERDIRETLHEIQGIIIDGPSQLSLYRIRLNIQPTNTKEIHKALDFLRQQPTIIDHFAQE